MTPPPPPAYVIVWRAPPSARYRTYVDPTSNRPLALPLTALAHPPRLIFDTAPHFRLWEELTHPQPAVALLEQVARDHLGWDPVHAGSLP